MVEFEGQTGSKHKIELPSSISAVRVKPAAASVGERIEVTVVTHFVGDGAKVKIEAVDADGRKAGQVEGQIVVDAFTGTFEVPESAEGMTLTMEVSLPDYGLSATSGEVRIKARRKLTEARWANTKATLGEIVEMSARAEGFPDGTSGTFTVFEHDPEGVHRRIARVDCLIFGGEMKSLWVVEYPEPLDEIPTSEESDRGYINPEFFFAAEAEGVEATSNRLELRSTIVAYLKDRSGNPLPEREYVLTLPDGSTRTGKSDEAGKVVVEDAPPGPWKLAPQ